jgi:hypothetical protein
VQDPNVLLTILSRMAQRPEVKFDKLFQKLYNTNLWLMAYESIAPIPGNMTKGIDDRTADGMGMERICAVITDLKASRYKPTPVRRTYIKKANGKMRPISIPMLHSHCTSYNRLWDFALGRSASPAYPVYHQSVILTSDVTSVVARACAARR